MGFDMNYKIKVANEVESKEAQELLLSLGGVLIGSKDFYENTEVKAVCLINNYILLNDISFESCDDALKEITLPELRDLVVLKRNNVGDATHTDQDNWKWYVGADAYVWQAGNAQQLKQWDKSGLYMVDLKPIEKKEMKEYLRKNSNSSYSYIGYVHAGHVSDSMIEIPEGADIAISDGGTGIFFYKNGDLYFSGFEWRQCSINSIKTVNAFIATGATVLWQRESPNDKLASAEQYRQAEVLPFIDDEPKSAWDTQVGGDHYKKYKIQPMLFALENNLNPLQHSVLKYIMRHEDKNGKQDLEKAKHYIDLMIAHYYPAE